MGRVKGGGFVGNLAKLGGRQRRLAMKTDMRNEHLVHSDFKKSSKQAHKRV
jgi:hypothetical protein